MLALNTSTNTFPCPLGVPGLVVIELVRDGIPRVIATQLLFLNQLHLDIQHAHHEEHETSNRSTQSELDGGRIRGGKPGVLLRGLGLGRGLRMTSLLQRG